jgi:glycine/D-amino acid oxidase-like deaminating enzyme
MAHEALSWWHASAPRGVDARDPLPGDRDVDVAIIGAGFTGLWTASHPKRANPGLRICILEREIAGFGASGRNGGWCVGSTAPMHRERERRQPGSALRL